MKIKKAVMTILISVCMLLFARSAYAQQGSWFDIYNTSVLLPGMTGASVTITNAPNILIARCKFGPSQHGGYVSILDANTGNTISSVDCSATGAYDSNYARVDGPGLTYRVYLYNRTWWLGNVENNQVSIDVEVKGYNLINQSGDGGYSGTPIPIPTNAPTQAPTTAPTQSGGTGGTGGNGGTGGAGSLCGTEAAPCYVIISGTTMPANGQMTPFAIQFPSSIAVNNFPTPLPTATMRPEMKTAYAAIDNPNAPVALSGSYTGQSDIIAEAVGSEEDMSGVSAFKTENYDFGCQMSISAQEIEAGLCVKYRYVTAISIVGYDIPVGILMQAMLVLVVVYIIRSR